jgi:hypothetical protein
MKKLLLVLTFFLVNNIAQANCIEGDCKDGFGTYTWGLNQETIYVGNFKNFKFHGNGKMTWSDGGTYEGQYFEGNLSGKGIMIWMNGQKYEGGWLNNLYDGQGKMTWINGETYSGGWKAGKKHGKGFLKWFNGNTYEGEFKNGIENGKGIFKGIDGSYYNGNYLNASYDGYGMWKSSSGHSYKGQYKNGMKHGKGEYYWDEKTYYVGEWNNDQKHGKGKHQYQNGDSFIGIFENDIIQKSGIYKWSNGDVYSGGWVDGRREGNGILKFYKGDIYKGQFKNGRFHGKGKYQWTSGGFYEGDYINGVEHGKGFEKYSTGDTYEGEFKNGSREGKGTAMYADTGNKHIGIFINNEKHGPIKIVKKNGEEEIIIFDMGDAKKSLEDGKLNTQTTEKYYALIIGNNKYKNLKNLGAAVNDAEVIANILKNKYGFEVNLLLNANHEKTINSVYSISRKLTKNDNLLIFYAGHGVLDKKENRGYWLPTDAEKELPSKWISNAFISDQMKATEAKHVLLIVDSCFAGTLMRSGTNNIKKKLDAKYIKRLQKKKTRLVITSGGVEPVLDNIGGNHSVFSQILIDILRESKNVISTASIFEQLRRSVGANADQMPERAVIHKTGHDGGDFLFFPKS